ncbi:MAG: hypothetical protein AAF843_12940 [Bacteroidota bacterium]
MKRIKYLLFLLPALLVGCFDENDLDENVFDSAPLVSIDEPSGSVTFGDAFNVVFTFTDGNLESASLSPLSSASYTIVDAIGADVDSGTPAVSGITTTTTIPFAEGLPLGEYTIEVTVTDTNGNTGNATTTFSVTESTTFTVGDFEMNHPELFILGTMNGWGGSDLQMTAVADNEWQIDNVTITNSDQFKFSNTPDFSNEDWGDEECDGIASSNMSAEGAPNIICGFNGRFNVTFNDQSLEYSLAAAFAANFESLFVLGTFNDFQGTNLGMGLVADNVWELKNLEINVNDAFRFSTTFTLADMHYGQNGSGSTFDDVTEVVSGTAEEFGPNFVLPPGAPHGRYDLQYNDVTGDYTFTLVEQLSFTSNNSEMYILGEMNGWGGTDLQMELVDDFTWQREEVTLSSTNPFKFANSPDFGGGTTDWGDADCDNQAEEFGADIACGFDGTFTFTFNDQTLEYSVE